MRDSAAPAFSDFLAPTFRTAVFGLIIGTIACFQGMRSQGGTEGVGRSATSSVVLSSLFVIVADVILVKIDSGVLSMMHTDQAVRCAVTTRAATAARLRIRTRNSAEPALVLQGLHKSFGAQKVLNGIDLTLGSGKTLAILGRSGTGKSVLLKLIIGLQKPDSGSIRIHGQEIADSQCRSDE